jgi:predicted enzyme related to lactoylglutathione lyase
MTGVTGASIAGAGAGAVGGTAGSSGSVAGAARATAGTPAGVAGAAASAAGISAPTTGGSSGGSGGVTASAGTTAAIGGSAAAIGGSGGTAGMPMDPSLPIPTPMSAPLVWGFGIGISDVAAAVKFYADVMKVTVEKESVKRDDSTETVLYGTQAKRGARVVLIKFDDMRETRKITAKLVWQSSNAAGVNRAAAMYPDYMSRVNFGIVQFDGPETYIQEVGGIFDTDGGSISVPYPIALGFAVSDLPASRKFYTSLGMTESSLGSFSVTDATGTGNITEYSVKFAEGTGVVLQQWTPTRNAKNNPIKVIMFVPDAKAMSDKVIAGGGTMVKPAERSDAYDNRLVVVAKDLDGYVLDIVE